MYDLQDLIDHIKTECPTYTVGWIKETDQNLPNQTDAVSVLVGYHSVDADGVLGDGSTPDPFVQFSEDLILYAIVQFNCKSSDFPVVWRALYHACSKWIPMPAEADYTAFTHSGGGVKGIQSGRMSWVDRWRISFPRASQF